MDHLRPFGCRAYGLLYEGERKKLDPKAMEGIHLGYEPHNSRCYRVYYPEIRRIKYTVHVTHDEKSFPMRGGVTTTGTTSTTTPVTIEGDSDESADSVGATRDQGDDKQKEETKNHAEDNRQARTGWNWSDEVRNQANSLGRSRRGAVSTMCQDADCPTRGPHLAHLALEYACVATDFPDDPITYEEAIKSPDSSLWRQAMDEEIAALKETGTFLLCEIPKGRKAIGSKWLYKAKRDESGMIVRYKARVVAKGFSQQPGVDFDQTSSPVAKLVTIRVVMALTAYESWIAEAMDVKNAYLQANVVEVVFVKQPKGYEVKGPAGEELVWQLVKSLYGLKQASRNWNVKIDGWFQGFGFKRSSVDPCVYILNEADGNILIVVLYVDDLLIVGNNRQLIDRFKAAISKEFEMTDLGAARWILGMEIRRDMENKTIELYRQPTSIACWSVLA